MVSAWVYDNKYMDETFNYEDLEKKYIDQKEKTIESPIEVKEKLDQAHKM